MEHFHYFVVISPLELIFSDSLFQLGYVSLFSSQAIVPLPFATLITVTAIFEPAPHSLDVIGEKITKAAGRKAQPG
jgi:hypothetical protein